MYLRPFLALCAFVFMTHAAHALECPAIPEAVKRDVVVETELGLAKIAKLSGAEFKNKTSVLAKEMFSKYPNADRLLYVNMMLGTFCQIINESNFNDKEKMQKFNEFNREMMRFIGHRSDANEPPHLVFELLDGGNVIAVKNTTSSVYAPDVTAEAVVTFAGGGGNCDRQVSVAAGSLSKYVDGASKRPFLLDIGPLRRTIAELKAEALASHSCVDVYANIFGLISYEDKYGREYNRRFLVPIYFIGNRIFGAQQWVSALSYKSLSEQGQSLPDFHKHFVANGEPLRLSDLSF